jgi:hypothetical protein
MPFLIAFDPGTVRCIGDAIYIPHRFHVPVGITSVYLMTNSIVKLLRHFSWQLELGSSFENNVFSTHSRRRCSSLTLLNCLSVYVGAFLLSALTNVLISDGVLVCVCNVRYKALQIANAKCGGGQITPGLAAVDRSSSSATRSANRLMPKTKAVNVLKDGVPRK